MLKEDFTSVGIIKKNQSKLFGYMFVTTVILGLLGCFISQVFHFGLTGTGCFLLAAGVIDFIAYYYSDSFIIKSENAIKIEDEQVPEYYELVKNLCDNANIKMPRLYFIDTPAINAFATGRNIDKAVLVVTKGLLEKLNPDEIKGVIGHELAHIESGDMKLMSVLSILSGLICILSDMIWYSGTIDRASSRDQSGVLAIIGLVISLLAPITSVIIKFAVSRNREFVADARGAEIAGNPEFLAKALNKIKHDRIQVPNPSKATAHLYIASPFRGDFIGELFSTHPDIDERINRLNNMKLI